MRADMHKIFVERPRRQGFETPDKPRSLFDAEAFPSKVGLRRRVRATKGLKEVSENLVPLYPYLGRQVNRPWGKVYSEIRKSIDVRSAVQAHVLTDIEGHLKFRDVHKVEATVDVPCGPICSHDGHGRRATKEGQLYVNPEDGIIKKARIKACQEARTRARR